MEDTVAVGKAVVAVGKAVVAADVDSGVWGSHTHCSLVAAGICRPVSSWLLLLGEFRHKRDPIKNST